MVTPNVPWQRLVLPIDSVTQLSDAVARLEFESLVLDDWGLRDRARATRGVRLLFSGPPGTGKSMAAEVIATAAATDLLVVDVSQIVSKWLGETEKNVSAVIDAAERTQAVVFFDEADNLFAKRTEISDAHDRYANLETSYLLQRLDHFEGVAVLATNLRHNIDTAFLRRMDFVIDFALPDLDCRRQLWALHLPGDVLAADVDVDVLARMYSVPGGWIRNAAIAAAFLAARSGGPIRQDHLVAAVRREYLKAALPFPGEPPRRRDDQML
jgi:SpoVK/Ycf46/Vps4 family AAA+-type ATPase